MKLFDSTVLIAHLRGVDEATAGADLLTLNVRHFPMFEDIEPAF